MKLITLDEAAIVLSIISLLISTYLLWKYLNNSN